MMTFKKLFLLFAAFCSGLVLLDVDAYADGMRTRAQTFEGFRAPASNLLNYNVEGFSLDMTADQLTQAIVNSGYEVTFQGEPGEVDFDIHLARETEGDISRVIIDRHKDGTVQRINYDLMYKNSNAHLAGPPYQWSHAMLGQVNSQFRKQLGVGSENTEKGGTSEPCVASVRDVRCNASDEVIRPKAIVIMTVGPDYKKVRITRYLYALLKEHKEQNQQ